MLSLQCIRRVLEARCDGLEGVRVLMRRQLVGVRVERQVVMHDGPRRDGVHHTSEQEWRYQYAAE